MPQITDWVIDADAHITEPADLWSSRLPAKFRNTQNLPNQMILYRGTDAPRGHDRGFSWTLNKEKAKWFANRWTKNGRLRVIEVLREGVMLYSDDRDEAECVYFGPVA